MGHFSLTKKKVNDSIEETFTNSKNAVTNFKFGFSQRKMSQDPNTKFSQNPSAKPVLSIETNVANNITPPPTPSESPQPGNMSSMGFHNGSQEKRGSTRSIIRSTQGGTTPPQSPASKSPLGAKPHPRTPFSSLTLFRTPRQRKLREIRKGKLPAIITAEFSRTSLSSPILSDTDSVPTEIYDPSSSTTYNSRTRSKKQSENRSNHTK
jgi:hypothetical protein